MIALVQFLQLVSGVAWLLPAIVLTSRIVGSWKRSASRATMLAAPIGFLAWMQVGFTVRWLVWPHALTAMNGTELTTWAALYALSALLAGWFLAGAFETRNG